MEGAAGQSARRPQTPHFFPPGTRSPRRRGRRKRGSAETRRTALRVVRNQVDPSELEGRILGLGRGCPTDEEGDTQGRDRPPTRGVRASQSRAPAFGPWPGTCPRAGTRCSPRASPVSPCSPPSSARSGRGPAPLAPAGLPDQGRRRFRARAPRQPHANFPAAVAATLGGGGGGGRGRGQERLAGGAAAEGPRLPHRAPARASALPQRPRGATRPPRSSCPTDPSLRAGAGTCLADSCPAELSPRTPPRRPSHSELTGQTPARGTPAGRLQLPAGKGAVDGQVGCVVGARPEMGAVAPCPFLSLSLRFGPLPLFSRVLIAGRTDAPLTLQRGS